MIGLPSAPCVAIHDVQKPERLPDAVVRRIAGDDAVVVVGIALRFLQRLVAAGRTADEVRLARRTWPWALRTISFAASVIRWIAR